jgi:TPR repeat protein
VPSIGVRSNDIRRRQKLIYEANAGDLDAQSRLGNLYREGDDATPKDYEQALHWYRLAAEQGDAKAANNLGAMYQHGMGVPADMKEAVKWYRRAAKQGLAVAQWNLAVCLLYGSGAKQEVGKAVEWLRKASRQGHLDATAQLGTLYQLGEGVERNIPFAAELHTIAASRGDVESAARLGDYRQELEAEAVAGNELAALALAKMYDKGLGVPESKPAMYAWLTFAEEYATRDGIYPESHEELLDMRGWYALMLSDEEKDAATDIKLSLIAKREKGASALAA